MTIYFSHSSQIAFLLPATATRWKFAQFSFLVITCQYTMGQWHRCSNVHPWERNHIAPFSPLSRGTLAVDSGFAFNCFAYK